MPVTLTKEDLDPIRWPTKAKPNPRRSRQASSKKWVPIVNIAKSPVTTLGSAPCLLFLSLLFLRILLYSRIVIFSWAKWITRWRRNSLASSPRRRRGTYPSKFGSPKRLSHMSLAQNLFGFPKLSLELLLCIKLHFHHIYKYYVEFDLILLSGEC